MWVVHILRFNTPRYPSGGEEWREDFESHAHALAFVDGYTDERRVRLRKRYGRCRVTSSPHVTGIEAPGYGPDGEPKWVVMESITVYHVDLEDD